MHTGTHSAKTTLQGDGNAGEVCAKLCGGRTFIGGSAKIYQKKILWRTQKGFMSLYRIVRMADIVRRV